MDKPKNLYSSPVMALVCDKVHKLFCDQSTPGTDHLGHNIEVGISNLFGTLKSPMKRSIFIVADIYFLYGIACIRKVKRVRAGASLLWMKVCAEFPSPLCCWDHAAWLGVS